METFKFHNDAPMIKYCQKSFNRCCFISLASVFTSIEQIKAANTIYLRKEEYLKSKVGNRIDFENAILKSEKNLKVNQECIIAW